MFESLSFFWTSKIDYCDSASFGASIKIVVGENKQKFYFRKDLICPISRFFEAIHITEEQISERERVITLEKEDPDIFTIFAAWLTSGSIRAAKILKEAATLDIRNSSKSSDLSSTCIWSTFKAMIKGMDAQFYQLLECYYLGCFLQAERFLNYIMDRIVGLVRWRTEILKKRQAERYDVLATTGTQIQKFYQRTSKDSPLRQFILEYHLQEVGRRIIDAESIKLITIRRRRRTPNYCDRPQCHFHVHSAESQDFICTETVL
jgi:hypothetical protein